MSEHGILEATVFFGQVGKVTAKAGAVVTIKLENPRLWAPGHPFLYKMQVGRKHTTTTNFLQFQAIPPQVELSSGDEVNSYAGLRTLQLAKEGDKQIILLNGKPLDFQVQKCLNSFNNHILLQVLDQNLSP